MVSRTVRKNVQSGFSLLEVMFALPIFLVAVLGVAASSATFANIRRFNEEKQIAIVAARQQLDAIRGTAFNQIIATFNDLNFQVNLNGDAANDLRPQQGDGDGNVGRVVVTQAGPAGNAGSLLQVEVTIAWRGVLGNRQYQIGTLIANRSGT